MKHSPYLSLGHAFIQNLKLRIEVIAHWISSSSYNLYIFNLQYTLFYENAGLADFADQNRKLLSMMNAVFLSLV